MQILHTGSDGVYDSNGMWVLMECAGLINLISIKISSVKYKQRESTQSQVKLLSSVETKEKKR